MKRQSERERETGKEGIRAEEGVFEPKRHLTDGLGTRPEATVATTATLCATSAKTSLQYRLGGEINRFESIKD